MEKGKASIDISLGLEEAIEDLASEALDLAQLISNIALVAEAIDTSAINVSSKPGH